MSVLVITPPSDLDLAARVTINGAEVEWKLADVKIKKNVYELKQSRRSYRERYNKKPHVQVNSYLRSQDETLREKKRAYSKLPHVKERKKEVNSLHRKFKNYILESYPSIYNEVLKNTDPMKLRALETRMINGGGDPYPTILGQTQ